MQLPSVKNIEALHQKYAPNQKAFEAVYEHSRIVWDIAQELIEVRGLRVDAKLVRTGALLHDIGVYKLYNKDGEVEKDNYILHGLIGHDLLSAEGLSAAVCRFASHHTGVGLTKEDIIAQGHSLPLRDLLAESSEELLVMYADKFHTKSVPPYFNTANYCKRNAERFGADKVIRFEAMMRRFGLPDIHGLAEKYGQHVR